MKMDKINKHIDNRVEILIDSYEFNKEFNEKKARSDKQYNFEQALYYIIMGIILGGIYVYWLFLYLS